MNEHIQYQLSDYLDGMLSATDRQKADAHLSTCAACRNELEQLQTIRELLKTQPVLQPPESFYAGVHARLNDRPRGFWSWNAGMKLAATACTLLLAVIVTHELRKDHGPEEAPEMLTTSAPVEPLNSANKVVAQAQKSATSGALDKEEGNLAATNSPMAAADKLMAVQPSRQEFQLKAAGRVTPASFAAQMPPSVSTQIIGDAASWQGLWGNEAPPMVDFQNAVVAVVTNSDVTRTVDILRVDTTASALVVDYSLEARAEPAKQSFAYKVLPKTALPITFQQVP